VVADLDELATYIQRDSPQAALRFLQSAQETFELLARMPELGGVFQVTNPRLSGIRVWQVKGFENILVFYRPQGRVVEIVRVLHGARDLTALIG
jgi:toxin ParE1/3/4